jgi:hypothetical protein
MPFQNIKKECVCMINVLSVLGVQTFARSVIKSVLETFSECFKDVIKKPLNSLKCPFSER